MTSERKTIQGIVVDDHHLFRMGLKAGFNGDTNELAEAIRMLMSGLDYFGRGYKPDEYAIRPSRFIC